MRSGPPTLAPLFRSDHQLRILASLYLFGGEWSISDLAEHAEVSMATASREVRRLVDSGLASVRPWGQLRLVQADQDLPWAGPLVELLDQSVGPVHHLRALLDDPAWAEIEEAHIFGSWARRYHGESGSPPNDIDVLLVTRAPLPPSQVLAFQRALEARVGLRVDAFAVTPADWSSPTDEAVEAVKAGRTVPVRRLVRQGGEPA